jgi:hypothetical protein
MKKLLTVLGLTLLSAKVQASSLPMQINLYPLSRLAGYYTTTHLPRSQKYELTQRISLVQPEGGKLIQEQSQKLSRPASRKLGDKKAIVFTGQAFTLALLPTLLSFTVIGATEKPETTVEPELARSDSVLAVAKVWADSDILSVAALVGDRSPRKGQASYSKVALARGLTGEEEEESSEELQDKLSKAVEFAADTY